MDNDDADDDDDDDEASKVLSGINDVNIGEKRKIAHSKGNAELFRDLLVYYHPKVKTIGVFLKYDNDTDQIDHASDELNEQFSIDFCKWFASLE